MKLFLTLLVLCVSVASSVAQTTTTVNLTWEPSPDTCDGGCPARWYHVYAGTENDCATTAMPLPTKAEPTPGAIVVVDAPATSFSYTFPTGTAVCWEITAMNFKGESPHSNRAFLGVTNPGPQAPSGLRVAKL